MAHVPRIPRSVPARKLHRSGALNYDQTRIDPRDARHRLARRSNAPTSLGTMTSFSSSAWTDRAERHAVRAGAWRKAGGDDVRESRLDFCANALDVTHTIVRGPGVVEQLRSMGDSAHARDGRDGQRGIHGRHVRFARAGRPNRVGLFDGNTQASAIEFPQA